MNRSDKVESLDHQDICKYRNLCFEGTIRSNPFYSVHVFPFRTTNKSSKPQGRSFISQRLGLFLQSLICYSALNRCSINTGINCLRRLDQVEGAWSSEWDRLDPNSGSSTHWLWWFRASQFSLLWIEVGFTNFFFYAILGTNEISLRITQISLAFSLPANFITSVSYTPLSKCFQKSLRDSHTKLLLLDTALLHGHWGSPRCPTAPLGASLASVYTGHLSHIVNLPGLVSPSCLLSLLPLNLWSQQIPPLLPQGAIPDNRTQGLKVAWWSVVMYPLGQYSESSSKHGAFVCQ